MLTQQQFRLASEVLDASMVPPAPSPKAQEPSAAEAAAAGPVAVDVSARDDGKQVAVEVVAEPGPISAGKRAAKDLLQSLLP